MNGSTYPGGMLTGLVYEEAMDSDVFGELMSHAGYEGRHPHPPGPRELYRST
jgi:hypothetical protein